jgi:hypothetical protein
MKKTAGWVTLLVVAVTVLVCGNASVTTSTAQPPATNLGRQLSDDDPFVCSNQTLEGDYGFTIHGQVTTPVGAINRDGVAMTHFNGNGNLTQVDFVLSNGTPDSPGFRTGQTGTYTVNPDCTGSAEIDFPAPPGASHGAVIKLMFVLTNHGRQIHTVVSSLIPPGAPGPLPAAIHSDAERLARVAE